MPLRLPILAAALLLVAGVVTSRYPVGVCCITETGQKSLVLRGVPCVTRETDCGYADEDLGWSLLTREDLAP